MLIYSPLHLRFPPTLGGLVRTDPATFDEDGSNVSIGYHGVSERIDLTLYIYPRSFGGISDPEEHFKSAIGAALQLSPRGKLERAAPKPLPLGSDEVPGYAALIHWPSSEGETASFLFLAPRGHRFVKLRATFLLDGSGAPIRRAAELSMRLLESLHIPAE
jgi:hypothetical protein